MKREKLYLLMALSLVLFALTTAVFADSEKSGFDYSSEKMECRFQPSAFDMDEAEKTVVCWDQCQTRTGQSDRRMLF